MFSGSSSRCSVYDCSISWSYSLTSWSCDQDAAMQGTKTLLNILWNQKTKMPPIPYMVLTFKFFWLPWAWYAHSMGGRTMLNYFFRRWIVFRAVFTSTQVFMKERKKVVSHLLQKNWRRLLPVTQSSLTSNIRKMKFWGFQFSFLEGHVKIDWKIMWDLLSDH